MPEKGLNLRSIIVGESNHVSKIRNYFPYDSTPLRPGDWSFLSHVLMLSLLLIALASSARDGAQE